MKEGTDHKMEVQQRSVIMVKVTSESNGVTEVADRRSADVATIWETLDIQSEELSEGKLLT